MITNLIKINTVDITKLTDWEVERNKLWTDAGRNMAGDLRSTFVGIFPKVQLSFGYLTAEEVSEIAGLLDNPSFTVEWWDVVTQSLKSGTYYASDFSIPIWSKAREMYKPFKVSLVPFNKMS